VTILPIFAENAVQISGQMLRGPMMGMQEGAFAAGDMKVVPGAALTVDVPGGVVLVQGDSVFDQGLYRCALDATINSAAFPGGGITAAHATLPRIDQIVARVYDQDVDGLGSRLWRPEVVTGVATSGATLANRTGAAALPASAMRLCDLLVPAAFAGPFVQATHIRDRRPWARGAFVRKFIATLNTVSATYVEMDTTNLTTRIECSGNPIRIVLDGTLASNSIQLPFIRPMIDGATVDGQSDLWVWSPYAAGIQIPATLEWITWPTAGSHLFSAQWHTTGGSQVTFAPIVFSVQEQVRQNVENTGA
jgi:hypothetical protein